jgi:hypothetical protein
MVTGTLACEGHNVNDDVYINVTCPGLIPVTRPALLIEAIAALLLDQIPPDVGVSVVVEPGHMVLVPINAIIGLVATDIVSELFEAQPVLEFVNLNVAIPVLTPVIRPPLVMLATLG